MYEQVTNLGVDIEIEEVLEIKKGKTFTVITDSNTYEAKSVIIATGAKYRLLGLENETNLIGNGIHFCVACDGAFYKDKTVAGKYIFRKQLLFLRFHGRLHKP